LEAESNKVTILESLATLWKIAGMQLIQWLVTKILGC
jgi:hypothetical protein